MRSTIFLLIQFSFIVAFGQELNLKNNQGGIFSLGGRSTISLFNGHEEESNGMGVGGQFRLQFSDRVNSDWFFDYIQSDIGDYAARTDYHIGWSVLYYPTAKSDVMFRPYILAGHCFDYTQVEDLNNRLNRLERWSSAVQGGAGVHWNLSPRLDVSLVAQYMLHLGNEILTHMDAGQVEFEEVKGASAEGHLLFHVGVNYKIVDLW